MTLAEHDALLKAEGRYGAMWERQKLQEEERAKREAERLRAEAPIIADLVEAGYAVRSVWDLVNTTAPYPNALPVLLDHVSRPYPGPVREGIARALAVPEAKFGWDVLTRLYGEESDPRVKDGLAVSLAVIADDEVLDDLIGLVRDTRHGSSRLLLLSALERCSDPRAIATLMELGSDPDLLEEIQVILRRRKRKKR